MRTSSLLLLLGLPLFLQAQAENSNKEFEGTLGGDIGVSTPTGDFDRTWGRNMFHLGAQLAFPLRRVPVLQMGFSFGYSSMGKSEQTVPIDTDYLGITEGTLTVRCKSFSYHPMLRLSPLRGRVRPYVDGMVGARQFSTTSKVTADDVEENISKERNATDWAASIGWAGGVMVTLGGSAYLELRVERFDSDEASFVDPESVVISDQGEVDFTVITSNTDVTNIMLGVGFRF